jgi:hypothetical protein
LFTTGHKRLAEGGFGDWIAWPFVRGRNGYQEACDAAAAKAAAVCVSASLRTETVREIKENMGQCESK